MIKIVWLCLAINAIIFTVLPIKWTSFPVREQGITSDVYIFFSTLTGKKIYNVAGKYLYIVVYFHAQLSLPKPQLY